MGGKKNKRSIETSCMMPKWWPKGKQERRDFSVCVALSLILSVRRAMIERARFSFCVVTLSRSPRIMNRFSPFFSFFTNVGSITIVYFQSRAGNFQFRNSLGSKKKKKKLAVTMDRFVIHTRRNTRSGGTWNVVIESSLTDESYHLDISSSLCPLTHTIRFYLKVSRNISLWASSIRFEHGFTDVRDPGSRRIVAVLFLARGTDRGGNAWIAINDAEQKRSIPWWNVAERNGGVPFGTNGETINETFSFHGRR